MVCMGRLEKNRPTSPLTIRGGVRSLFEPVLIKISGGAKQDRTADLLRARQALSQLSYSPSLLISKGLLLLICYHVICVDTHETEVSIKLFYFKIRR